MASSVDLLTTVVPPAEPGEVAVPADVDQVHLERLLGRRHDHAVDVGAGAEHGGDLQARRRHRPAVDDQPVGVLGVLHGEQPAALGERGDAAEQVDPHVVGLVAQQRGGTRADVDAEDLGAPLVAAHDLDHGVAVRGPRHPREVLVRLLVPGDLRTGAVQPDVPEANLGVVGAGRRIAVRHRGLGGVGRVRDVPDLYGRVVGALHEEGRAVG
jgi:hypothetical protein